MRKLKKWELIFLIIFYPAGIVYFLIWLYFKVSGKEIKSSSKIDSSKLTIKQDFYTKVVGVTFKNNDGTSRQKYIKECKSGDGIVLKPLPTLEYPNAIGVFTEKGGKQLGYLKDELATEITQNYGYNLMKITVENITGSSDSNYGCNLHIVIYNESAEKYKTKINISVPNNNMNDIVFVNKGSKVYHCDQLCAMSRSVNCSEMNEKQAIKKGLKRCRKCYGNFN